ncbi:zf-HC2 domain-containing protein [Methylomonas sp. EFPC3]|uniref:zf-HC2 domain-containing protein n=1 Tax=Methylomonas sp. EFPC3 TaxID=3021710 RepID=UPI002415E74C|nr:zf-HC2 domain-containing protein [Methylomonas sp. EFPC3]WFP49419.1 zf-HC2 domain-containing protein [Methylomonas sp. EFPC3]
MKPHHANSVDGHAEVVLLLPWYANRTLAARERQTVENHLKTCLICRRELSALEQLAIAVQQAADLDGAAEASWVRMHAGLSLTPRSAAPTTPNQRRPRRLFQRELAVCASIFLLALAATLRYQPHPVAEYQTLSAAKPVANPAGQLRVVFAESLQIQDIDALLSQIGATRNGGPNSVGAYTVSVTAAADQVLSALRSRRDVVLAEPIVQP